MSSQEKSQDTQKELGKVIDINAKKEEQLKSLNLLLTVKLFNPTLL